jgi:hypothetical protein
MAVHTIGSGPSPETRRVRFKEVLVLEFPPFSIGAALEAARYRLRPAAEIDQAIRSVGHGEIELVVISDLVGDRALHALMEELRAHPAPPPAILVPSLQGVKRWEAWKSLSGTSIVRSPFKMNDVVEAVRAQIGDPWVDLGAGPGH